MSKKEEVPEKNLELREIQQDEASGVLFADWNHPPPARIPGTTRIMNRFFFIGNPELNLPFLTGILSGG